MGVVSTARRASVAQAQEQGSRLSECWGRGSKFPMMQNSSFFSPVLPLWGHVLLVLVGSLPTLGSQRRQAPPQEKPGRMTWAYLALGLRKKPPLWCPFPWGTFPGPLYQSEGSPEAEEKGPQHLATFRPAYYCSPPRFHLRIAWEALKKYKPQIQIYTLKQRINVLLCQPMTDVG